VANINRWLKWQLSAGNGWRVLAAKISKLAAAVSKLALKWRRKSSTAWRNIETAQLKAIGIGWRRRSKAPSTNEAGGGSESLAAAIEGGHAIRRHLPSVPAA